MWLEPLSSSFGLVSKDGFSVGANGWSHGPLATRCGSYGNLLGGFHSTGVGASLKYVLDASHTIHTRVRIKFDFVFLDAWEGNSATLYMNDVLVWKHRRIYPQLDVNASLRSFGAWSPPHVLPEHYFVDECGQLSTDSRVRTDVEIPHSKSEQLSFVFSTDLDAYSGSLASWGIDNFRVSTTNSAPEESLFVTTQSVNRSSLLEIASNSSGFWQLPSGWQIGELKLFADVMCAIFSHFHCLCS